MLSVRIEVGLSSSRAINIAASFDAWRSCEGNIDDELQMKMTDNGNVGEKSSIERLAVVAQAPKLTLNSARL